MSKERLAIIIKVLEKYNATYVKAYEYNNEDDTGLSDFFDVIISVDNKLLEITVDDNCNILDEHKVSEP